MHKITKLRMGVDIGQKNDPTALVVTEQQVRNDRPYYVTRAVSRLPLGTSYVDVVNAIVGAYRNLEWQRKTLAYADNGNFGIEVVVDGTGVGLPIVDMLREHNLSPIVATFTGDDTYKRKGNDVRIGKGWMVSRLQVLLSTGRLLLPTGGEADVLVNELRTYEPKVNPATRHVSFNARSGAHDDLVIALGLSVGNVSDATPVIDRSAFALPEEMDPIDFARRRLARERRARS